MYGECFGGAYTVCVDRLNSLMRFIKHGLNRLLAMIGAKCDETAAEGDMIVFFLGSALNSVCQIRFFKAVRFLNQKRS